jgi:hypothetical protein
MADRAYLGGGPPPRPPSVNEDRLPPMVSTSLSQQSSVSVHPAATARAAAREIAADIWEKSGGRKKLHAFRITCPSTSLLAKSPPPSAATYKPPPPEASPLQHCLHCP